MANATHIPPMPLWVTIIRIFQGVVAFVCVGLAADTFNVFSPFETAYDANYVDSAFSLTGCRMIFFTFSWTILYLIYTRVAISFLNVIYNMWAHLALEILTCIFWLVAFALTASEASKLGNLEDIKLYSGYGVNIDVGDLLPAKYKTGIDCEKAAAGLGALEWLLFVITLVMFGIALNQHITTHGTGMGGAPTATNGATMNEEHKMETMNTMNVPPPVVQDPRFAPQYQQQQYQQQQYQQQQMA